MRSLIVVFFIVGGCSAASPFMFPGWERLSANEAAEYCTERGAELADVPVTVEEIRAASEACALGEEFLCWVGEPSEGAAHVITAEGNVVEVSADLGPAVALCVAR